MCEILAEHAQDAEVKEELEPLRHALVKRLDDIQKIYFSVVKDIEYNRAVFLVR